MTFANFLSVMETLLGENGCKWDKEQTHESLREFMLEECYEAIDAINRQDINALKEELGDVLLQVVFHAKLAEKAGNFTIDDVIAAITHKLVSRHSHVFGSDTAANAADVLQIWGKNKQKERAEKSLKSVMEDIPKALPALIRAAKVLKRSKMQKSCPETVINDIKNMLDNMKNNSDKIMRNEEFGLIMLQMVNLSDILEINAEFSLTNATEAFINTFSE